MIKTECIIIDGINTSYINTVIMALFYKDSNLRSFLSQIPTHTKFIYLQSMITNNYLTNATNNYCIDKSIVNEIKNYSSLCGWNERSVINSVHNIVEYTDFLLSSFDVGKIEIEYIVRHKNNTDVLKNIEHNYLSCEIDNNTSIKTLVKNWQDIQIYNSKSADISYTHLKEIPILIPIFLNRNYDAPLYEVDINKKIKFKINGDELQKNTRWIIHSIICYNSGKWKLLHNIMRIKKMVDVYCKFNTVNHIN